MSLTGLGDMLGPIFFAIDQKHDPVKLKQFYTYLEILPTDLDYFVDKRNEEFFANKDLMRNLFTTLPEIGIGSVITDTVGRQDTLHMHLPTRKAFIRFDGHKSSLVDSQNQSKTLQAIKVKRG